MKKVKIRPDYGGTLINEDMLPHHLRQCIEKQMNCQENQKNGLWIMMRNICGRDENLRIKLKFKNKEHTFI